MDSLKAIIKKLPKASAPRVVLQAALKGMNEHERRYRQELAESQRKREQLRAESDAAIDKLLDGS